MSTNKRTHKKRNYRTKKQQYDKKMVEGHFEDNRPDPATILMVIGTICFVLLTITGAEGSMFLFLLIAGCASVGVAVTLMIRMKIADKKEQKSEK